MITGAGSGIGRALALGFAGDAATLVLNDLNEAALADTIDEIAGSDARPQILSRCFDVSDREAQFALADELERNYGSADIVINNAGLAIDAVAVEHARLADLELLMRVNFWGVVHGTQAFLPQLVQKAKQTGEANLTNVSSIFGINAVAFQSPYCAAKFAVRGFSESLRAEAKLYYPGLTITVVYPGGIETNIAKNAARGGSRSDIEHDNDREKFETLQITTPATAAATIINGIRENRGRVLIGSDAKRADFIVRLLPEQYIKMSNSSLKKLDLVPESLAPRDREQG